MKVRLFLVIMAAALAAPLGIWFIPGVASAHCDTLDGPVVKTAQAALEKGDVSPVLKWVRKQDESEIRELFKKTLVVRSKGKEARELADRYFFETLVRIHRTGEGAPYTGLKPAGAVDPAVAEADRALESGSADSLVKMVTSAAAQGILDRFARTGEAKRHADESVEAGRTFVGTYVDFTHYVERLYLDARAGAAHGAAAEGDRQHHH